MALTTGYDLIAAVQGHRGGTSRNRRLGTLSACAHLVHQTASGHPPRTYAIASAAPERFFLSAILRSALCLPALVAAPAIADIRVSYVDSSPDKITIENRSGCALGPFELAIDLGRSAAGLIFDTSGAGAGYAAFAPLGLRNMRSGN